MKSSCIEHPAAEPLILMRKWQLEACEGDHCAAFLLSYLEYWHNIKVESNTKAQRANDIAERHGDKGTQDTSLWQWHTSEEIKAELLGLYSEDKLRAAAKRLEGLKFITTGKNPNPRYKFDATKFFLLNIEEINRWLSEYKKRVSASASTSEENRTSDPINREREPIYPEREPKNPEAIPETSSEIPSGDTTFTSSGAPDGAGVAMEGKNDEGEEPAETLKKKKTTIAERLKEAWNDLPKPFPKVKGLSEDRKEALRARCAEDGWLETVKEAMDRMVESEFCKGNNDRKWIADLDWFLRRGSVFRLAEGKYSNERMGIGVSAPKPQQRITLRTEKPRVVEVRTPEQEAAEWEEFQRSLRPKGNGAPVMA